MEPAPGDPRFLLRRKGAVPGAKGGYVLVSDAKKRPAPKDAPYPAAVRGAAAAAEPAPEPAPEPEKKD